MEEVSQMVSRHDVSIQNLEAWQTRQNGTLQKIEAKLDGINQWLIGLMGGLCVSLILLLVNLMGQK